MPLRQEIRAIIPRLSTESTLTSERDDRDEPFSFAEGLQESSGSHSKRVSGIGETASPQIIS